MYLAQYDTFSLAPAKWCFKYRLYAGICHKFISIEHDTALENANKAAMMDSRPARQFDNLSSSILEDIVHSNLIVELDFISDAGY